MTNLFYPISAIFFGVVIIITQAQWTPNPFCPYPSEVVTRYPYYGNCSLFWECFEGTMYVMECNEGQEFSAPLQNCADPPIANCDPFASTTERGQYTSSSDSTTESTQPPQSASTTTTTPATTDTTTTPATTDTTTTPATTETTEGPTASTISTSTTSEQPSSTTTTSYTSTTTTTRTTTEEPEIIDPRCGDNNSSVWPHPADCRKYIECYADGSYEMSCPPNLYFSDLTKGCVEAAQSECCADRPEQCP